MSHKTTWREVFNDSPRFKAIEGIFELIKKPDLTTNAIWAKANRVIRDLNAEEREKLPDFLKAALVDREPVRVGPPSMG